MFNWFLDVSKYIFNTNFKIQSNFPYNSSGDLINLINDPTTPLLVDKTPLDEALSRASVTNLKFNVIGFCGGNYQLNTPPGKAANCYMTTLKTLEMVKQHQFRPISRWAITPSIKIYPIAGKDLNAYYDRRAVKLFYHGNYYTANSAEILSHELGHGILDAFRPDTWSVQAIELWSFHEAFADLTSMLTVLQSDQMINLVLKETNNTLRTDNSMSKIAEEIGKAIYEISSTGGRNPNYLRNAINDYKYVDPTNLSEEGTYETISAECHSFGRIFLGAFYDILVMMYDHNRKKNGLKPTDALKIARNILTKYTLKAICHVPISPKFYEAFARTMLWVDWSDKKEYHNQMWDIFVNRNIIQPVKALNSINHNDVKGEILEKNENGFIIKSGRIETITIANHLPRNVLSSQKINPLLSCEVDVASENIYIFDKNGNSINYVETSTSEKIFSAMYCLDRLQATKSVSNDEKTPFEIVDNKLTRTNYDF